MFLHLATGLRLDLAFIVGAMVSATDPVAVVSTFKRLKVPPALATVVEGESLLNDGTGLVIFAIALQALAQPVGPAEAVVTFVATISGSAVIGLGTGFLAARLMSLVDDHLVELTISLVLAYGTYLLTDAFHGSGIIATVVAAVVLGNYGRPRHDQRARHRRARHRLGVPGVPADGHRVPARGLAIPPARLLDSAIWIGWGVAGALVGRAIVVYVLLRLAVRWLPLGGGPAGLPSGWYHVLFWSGLRGAVAVAAALSLPVDVPQRDLLQGVTFGIVLFTLLVQGPTAGLLVRRAVPESGSGA